MRRTTSPLQRYGAELRQIEGAADTLAALNMQTRLSAKDMRRGLAAHCELVDANARLRARILDDARPPIVGKPEGTGVVEWLLGTAIIVGILGLYSWLTVAVLGRFVSGMYEAAVSGPIFIP